MAGKKKMRSEIINKMQAISIQDKTQYENCLFAKLFASEKWQRAQTVAVTLSTPLEIQTDRIVQRAWGEDKKVLVPTTLPDWQMKFSEFRADTAIKLNDHGICEPVSGKAFDQTDIDLIIVPGLGFSISNGLRLGFGGGYYDRYLARYNGMTIALALPMQTFIKPEWPTYEYDIPIQEIMTCNATELREEGYLEQTATKD